MKLESTAVVLFFIPSIIILGGCCPQYAKAQSTSSLTEVATSTASLTSSSAATMTLTDNLQHVSNGSDDDDHRQQQGKNNYQPSQEEEEPRNMLLGILVGLCLALIILGAFAGVLAFLVLRNRQRRKDSGGESSSPSAGSSSNTFDGLDGPPQRQPPSPSASSRKLSVDDQRTSSVATGVAITTSNDCEELFCDENGDVATLGPKAIKEIQRRRQSLNKEKDASQPSPSFAFVEEGNDDLAVSTMGPNELQAAKRRLAAAL